ncbi:MAG: very short patch repair endonuclease [Brevundimonas sp.]|nr:very short patch repair endonuclease [Brevundimonas sp.]
MAKVKQSRTTPEDRVAVVLRKIGASYRRNVRTLPGRPDFANRSKGWVIQVHGCFWHQHDCSRGTIPSHNREAWLKKFAANRARDEVVENRLRCLGLRVLTVWECETKDSESLMRVLETYLE